MNIVWNDDERTYIRDHASVLTDEKLAAELSKIADRQISLQAARRQRQRMGLKKMRGRGVCKIDDSVE